MGSEQQARETIDRLVAAAAPFREARRAAMASAGDGGVEALPAVKWKLLSIERMSPEARERAIERLAQVLEQTKIVG
jgi:hypothetical protein